MTVTFIGHRDTPQNIYSLLYETVRTLIQNDAATAFYVGDRGEFDRMVLRSLMELKKVYPHIEYQIVLAYMPQRTDESIAFHPNIFPAEVAVAPARFAIDRRNRWMIEKSDVVVAYVRHSCGGAARFREAALCKGKRVINL